MEDNLKKTRIPAEACLIIIFGLIVAILLATTPQARAGKCNQQTDSSKAEPVCVVGHRGVAGLKPENTLAGFLFALKMGVDAIELDVVMTADKALVVHHDFNLMPDMARRPGGDWLKDRTGTQINEMTVNQLKTFDVGRLKPDTRYASRYPEQAPSDGERIPLLREVIQLIRHTGRKSVQLWIELKTSPEDPDKTPSPEIVAESVVALLKAENFTQHVKILSFDWRSLIHIQKIAPLVPRVFLTSETMQFKTASFMNPWESAWTAGFDIENHSGSIPQTILAAGGSWWAPKYNQLNTKQIEEAHRLGICVAVWTPDSTKAIKEMIEMGVDAIITNRPDRLLQILAERK